MMNPGSDKTDPSKIDENRPYLPALTGLRFLAAFVLLLAHCFHQICLTSDTKVFLHLGLVFAWSGMTLFFVLSGFVIHCNYANPFLTRPLAVSLRWFAVARLARLYPMYLVTFLICVGTMRFLDGRAEPFSILPFHLGMTQSWLYLPTYIGGWGITVSSFFPHGWSVSTEVFCYLLYPLLVLPLSRLCRPRSILAVSILFSVALFALLHLVGSHCQWLFRVASLEQWYENSGESFVGWLSYFSPLTRLLQFCMGCLAAQLYLSLRSRPLSARETTLGTICLIAAVASIVTLLYLSLSPTDNLSLRFLRPTALWTPGCAIVLFCLVRYDTTVSRLLSRRPFVVLGEASYSIYLLQQIVLRPFASLTSEPLQWTTAAAWILRLLAVIVLVFLVSLIAHRVVEIPARNLIRRLGSSAPSATPRWTLVKVVSSVVLFPTLFLLLGYSLYSRYQLPALYHARANSRLAQNHFLGSPGDLKEALRQNLHHWQERSSHANNKNH